MVYLAGFSSLTARNSVRVRAFESGSQFSAAKGFASIRTFAGDHACQGVPCPRGGLSGEWTSDSSIAASSVAVFAIARAANPQSGGGTCAQACDRASRHHDSSAVACAVPRRFPDDAAAGRRGAELHARALDAGHDTRRCRVGGHEHVRPGLEVGSDGPVVRVVVQLAPAAAPSNISASAVL